MWGDNIETYCAEKREFGSSPMDSGKKAHLKCYSWYKIVKAVNMQATIHYNLLSKEFSILEIVDNCFNPFQHNLEVRANGSKRHQVIIW